MKAVGAENEAIGDFLKQPIRQCNLKRKKSLASPGGHEGFCNMVNFSKLLPSAFGLIFDQHQTTKSKLISLNSESDKHFICLSPIQIFL
jgi:hypothetical protein